MKLYLVQHGEAKAEAEDPRRPLSVRGENEVRRVAQVAQRMELAPSKIYHSGQWRAKQTAEILAHALQRPVEPVPGLNPNDDVHPWANKISQEKEDFMFVGHLPFLEKLASLLIAGQENARVIFFRYGAIICLERPENQRWGVHWILTPEMT